MSSGGKIFVIGLSRTGTTSLHRAFGILGIDSAPTSVELMPLLDDPEADVPLLAHHTAFGDNPVPFLYEVLDRRCPGSLFIHTVRPVDEWLTSMRWLFETGVPRLEPQLRVLGNDVHRRLYGIVEHDEVVLSEVHRRHHDGVTRHFGDRDDVLHIDTAQLDWPEICDFLGVRVPDAVFPHANAHRPPPLFSRLAGRFGVTGPTVPRRGA